jgi:DNA mismatch endonuclease, patch repair protein
MSNSPPSDLGLFLVSLTFSPSLSNLSPRGRKKPIKRTNNTRIGSCCEATPGRLFRKRQMADVITKRKRSQVMAAIKSRGNKNTELLLKQIFRAYGIRGWRRHQSLPGKPDFIFRSKRLAVFVDGCFWHGCRQHCRMPQSNQLYWQQKISRNLERDRSVSRMLRCSGWKVVRIWEHSLKSPHSVAQRIKSKL